MYTKVYTCQRILPAYLSRLYKQRERAKVDFLTSMSCMRPLRLEGEPFSSDKCVTLLEILKARDDML